MMEPVRSRWGDLSVHARCTLALGLRRHRAGSQVCRERVHVTCCAVPRRCWGVCASTPGACQLTRAAGRGRPCWPAATLRAPLRRAATAPCRRRNVPLYDCCGDADRGECGLDQCRRRIRLLMRTTPPSKGSRHRVARCSVMWARAVAVRPSRARSGRTAKTAGHGPVDQLCGGGDERLAEDLLSLRTARTHHGGHEHVGPAAVGAAVPPSADICVHRVRSPRWWGVPPRAQLPTADWDHLVRPLDLSERILTTGPPEGSGGEPRSEGSWRRPPRTTCAGRRADPGSNATGTWRQDPRLTTVSDSQHPARAPHHSPRDLQAEGPYEEAGHLLSGHRAVRAEPVTAAAVGDASTSDRLDRTSMG